MKSRIFSAIFLLSLLIVLTRVDLTTAGFNYTNPQACESYRPGYATCVSSDSTTDIADAIGRLVRNDANFVIIQYREAYYVIAASIDFFPSYRTDVYADQPVAVVFIVKGNYYIITTLGCVTAGRLFPDPGSSRTCYSDQVNYNKSIINLDITYGMVCSAIKLLEETYRGSCNLCPTTEDTIYQSNTRNFMVAAPTPASNQALASAVASLRKYNYNIDITRTQVNNRAQLAYFFRQKNYGGLTATCSSNPDGILDFGKVYRNRDGISFVNFFLSGINSGRYPEQQMSACYFGEAVQGLIDTLPNDAPNNEIKLLAMTPHIFLYQGCYTLSLDFDGRLLRMLQRAVC